MPPPPPQPIKKNGDELKVGSRAAYYGGKNVGVTVLACYSYDKDALDMERQTLEKEVATFVATLPPPPPTAIEVGMTVQHNLANAGSWFPYTVTAVHAPADAGGSASAPTYDLMHADGSEELGVHMSLIRMNLLTPAMVQAQARLAVINCLPPMDCYDVAHLRRCALPASLYCLKDLQLTRPTFPSSLSSSSSSPVQ